MSDSQPVVPLFIVSAYARGTYGDNSDKQWVRVIKCIYPDGREDFSWEGYSSASQAESSMKNGFEFCSRVIGSDAKIIWGEVFFYDSAIKSFSLYEPPGVE